MKYTIDIGGTKGIKVDFLEFGIASEGAVQGWADLYINVQDNEMDIFTDSSKKVWIEWLNACCGDKNNPQERILPVVAKVFGGDDDTQGYRTIEIEHAYLASYVEQSVGSQHSYAATIRRAPIRKGKIEVKSS